MKELAMEPTDEVIELLEEAKTRLQMANALSSEKQYRIAVFDRPLDLHDFPLGMVCPVDVENLESPRLPGGTYKPDPDSSPFREPEVSSGYPLSKEEKEATDKAVERGKYV